MFSKVKVFAVIILSVLISFSSHASSDDNRRMIQDITNDFIEEYDLPPTQVIFISDVDQLEGKYVDAMAATECRRGRRTGRLNCNIYFETCVLELSESLIRNLAAHEAAHYVNAHINDRYDHGYQWARILRDQGWRVQRRYGEGLTGACL